MHCSCDAGGRFLSLRSAIAAALAIGSTGFFALPLAHAQEASSTAAPEKKSDEKDVANLSDVSVTGDALRAISNEPSGSSFGFAKPLLETPRAVTFVSEEQLSKFGIQSVQDLTRLVPGTYTTTRYGLQGAINVRSVTADQYYRGMKRLDQQGHVRTVLSAYDNIEVVKGPPSPIYGMGRIGGYTVLDPKSSRAKTGKYMTQEKGYFQGLFGSYKLSEIQFGEGVPFAIAGHTAGVYVVGLLENSQGWIKNVGAQQRFLQATASVDNAIGPFRIETGGQLQNSITSGSYMNRGTQALVDHGTYIGGQPMVNMDLNGDGRVGYVETYLSSPVTGTISANNRPLAQNFTWKLGSDGNPIPISQFQNSINGIPQTFKDYLNAHPEINCSLANYMRTTVPVLTTWTAGANAAATTQLKNYPVGFFMNPCTVKQQQVDYRGNGSFERQQNATQRMGYFDLVYDTNPDFTAKNQIFYDSIDSFKDSWLPYGERQYIKAIEEKMTVTRKLPSEWLPSWMNVNTLGSVNYRDTRGFIRSSGGGGGDFDYRQDIMYTTGAGGGWEGSGTGGHYPTTMFWNQLTNNSYATGYPADRLYYSQYSEKGVGVMMDVNFFTKTNLVVGGRRDFVDATVDQPSIFNQNPSMTWSPTIAAGLIPQYLAALQGSGSTCLTVGSGCPGAYTAPLHVHSSDKGTSWSASLSHELPWAGIRPYFTAASSTLSLDGSNNLFAPGTVQGTNALTTVNGVQYGGGGKIIGEAALREIGIKGTLFRGKAQWTLDAFRQTRNDVSSPSDPTVAVEVTSTETKGFEGDFKLVPTKALFLSLSAVYMKSEYLTGLVNNAQEVSGRDLGFQDIVDPTSGQVYPAEAFLYGGRSALLLTDPNNQYKDVPGLPQWQGSFNGTYQLPYGFGLIAGAQYFSDSWANRIKTVKLPSATVFDAGSSYDRGNLHLRLSVFNVADKRYFQSGQSTNANLLTVMPGRRWQLQLKAEF